MNSDHHLTLRVARRLVQAAPLLVFISAVPAQQWDSGGANNNWSTALNWATDVAPVNNGTANIIFGSGARTLPNVDAAWNINSLAFQVGAPAFTFGGQQLTLQGGGITNAGTNLQTINNSIVLGAPQTWSAGLGNLSVGGTSSVVNTNGNTLTVDGSNSTTLAAAISGTGGLIKNGSGTLTLGGSGNNNTYTGTTTVNAGTLVLNKSALSGDSTVTGNLIIGDGSGSDVVRLDANYQIKDSVGVTINSSGLLNLNGRTDDFTTLTMQGGTITTGAGSLGLFGDATTLAAATESSISGNLSLTGTRAFTVASGTAGLSGSDLNITANISGGGIIKNGNGRLRLAGNNTYSSGLIVNTGTLVLGSDTAAGTGAIVLNGGQLHNDSAPRTLANATTFGGGSVILSGAGGFTFTGPVTLFDSSTITAGTATTFSGPIGETFFGRGLTIASGTSSTVTFRGAVSNDYNGTTTVNSGTLVLDKAGGAVAILGPLVIGDGTGGANADVVRLQKPDQLLNGSAVVTVNSSGLFDLNGHHQAVNALTVTGGRVSTGTGDLYLNSAAAITTLDHAAPATISGNLTLSTVGDNTFDVAEGEAAVDLDIPAVIGGTSTGGVFKIGQGTLRLSGNNTFTTPFHHTAGTLAIGSDGALGSAYLNLNGGATGATLLADGAPRELFNNVFISGNSIIGGSQPLTISGVVYLGSVSPTTLHVYNSAKTTFESATFVQPGMTVMNDSIGHLDLAGGAAIEGVFKHVSGLLTSNFLGVSSGGSFIMQSSFLGSPTFDGTLYNRGTFTYKGGDFLGRLVNHGTTVFDADFIAGNGMENHEDLTITTGHYLTLHGAGYDNQGTTMLAGGTLQGNGPLVNNGLLSGQGTIGGTGGFTNYGVISQGNGPLTIANFAANYNYGMISLTAGRQLQLTSGSLNNRASLFLNNALVTGGSALLNSTAGTIIGPGVISAPLQNNGTIVPSGTLQVTQAWPNAGIVELTGPLSHLAGGTVSNSGTIQGHGTVSAPVINSGAIEPLGGTLALTGSLQNLPTGTLAVAAGNKLLLNSGLTTNGGSITLTGGTFDNNNRPLDNTGHLNGYGTLRTGGLTNHGDITFTGGVTTVSGNVTNASGSQVHVAYDSALFTGDFVNNGTFKNTDARVTFAGTYTENGTYISDPADNFFVDLRVGENGALTGGLGDRFIVSGDFITTSTQRDRWETGLSELRFSGGDGTHTLTVGGDDFGYSDAGFQNNFAWGIVSVNAGDFLGLADDGLAGGALYVGILDLDGGLPQLASIASHGLNIYYHPAFAENEYLGGQTWPLNGGGRLAPVPEPSSALLLAAGALLLRRRSRRSAR